MAAAKNIMRAMGVSASLLALTACANFDGDFRGDVSGGLDTSEAALSATAPRPQPDARGLITYPSYQVAIANRGETVSDVATRVGVPAAELARYNGIEDGVPLRQGETLVLATPAGPGTGTTGDITSIASAAIERTQGTGGSGGVQTTTLDGAGSSASEPVRHRVVAGETAFSIARTYGVTPRALADWNGLGADFEVREGQILLIPPVIQTAAAAPATTTTTLPGAGTVAPAPPSAAKPLPVEDKPETPAPVPASPKMAEEKTSSSELLMPVSGKVIRAFEKDKNNGIDIGASAGSQVKAAEAGTVAAISRDTNGILAVVIRHPDDLLTVYFGVEDETVAKGDNVKRGQVIGKVRNGSPAFLHFEVRRGFEPLDPMPFLN